MKSLLITLFFFASIQGMEELNQSDKRQKPDTITITTHDESQQWKFDRSILGQCTTLADQCSSLDVVTLPPTLQTNNMPGVLGIAYLIGAQPTLSTLNALSTLLSTLPTSSLLSYAHQAEYCGAKDIVISAATTYTKRLLASPITLDDPTYMAQLPDDNGFFKSQVNGELARQTALFHWLHGAQKKRYKRNFTLNAFNPQPQLAGGLKAKASNTTLEIHNPQNDAQPLSIDNQEKIEELYCKDGSDLIAAVSATSIKLWDTQGTYYGTISKDPEFQSIAFNPRQDQLASHSYKKIVLWNYKLSNQKDIYGLSDFGSFAYHPHEPLIAIGFREKKGLIRFYNTDSGNYIKQFETNQSFIHSLAFNHLGTHLAASCFANSLAICEMINGHAKEFLVGAPFKITFLADTGIILGKPIYQYINHGLLYDMQQKKMIAKITFSSEGANELFDPALRKQLTDGRTAPLLFLIDIYQKWKWQNKGQPQQKIADQYIPALPPEIGAMFQDQMSEVFSGPYLPSD